MQHIIYKFDSYRDYIDSSLKSENFGRGAKQKLAAHLNCQPSFISQVLKNKNDFSFEHAFKINEFLGHDNNQQDYFMTLVHFAKAGNKDLKKYYKNILDGIKNNQQEVEARLQNDKIKNKFAISFYSSWECLCIFSIIAIEELRNKDAIMSKLKINSKQFEKAKEILLGAELVTYIDNKFTYNHTKFIHLEKASPLSKNAAVLTRIKMIDQIDFDNKNHIHSSSIFTAPESESKELIQKIKDLIIECNEIAKLKNPQSFNTLIIDFTTS